MNSNMSTAIANQERFAKMKSTRFSIRLGHNGQVMRLSLAGSRNALQVLLRCGAELSHRSMKHANHPL